ncbi:ABC transporter permease [Geoalkalibacter halelectricus]|uniref:ABC transporter permease n=1 Tax=Geoalkalibacter halelectricus TaxID=2847045 RepID=UPI00266FA46B|nr:FtsX-like permease family protein [Geoalkalibacter halelectricus]MDO3380337.1 ABC transporter permease [Geoalkalibacter halelectricus]
MVRLLKIALRNLLRYKRRTLLTTALITLGVVFVLVFTSVTGSFKSLMIAQNTDSMLGHLQVHRRGYVASIDNLPLNLNLGPSAMKRLEEIFAAQPEIAAWSPRIKFGALFSTFVETTNIRLNGVDPEREMAVVPLLPARILEGDARLAPGEIWIPELLARGMKVAVGDTVVIVATNQDGSVNGRQFRVAAVLESVSGPGGRDGYLHIEDAAEVLRMETREISEVAIRLRDFSRLEALNRQLTERLDALLTPQGRPLFEVHTWEKLSPFYNIARMIEVMTFFMKLMLIAIVLVSIMNVMIMAVYERIREIGTMAAIGTRPGKILALFVLEGLSLGIFGALLGNLVGVLMISLLNAAHITYDFGRQKDLLLQVGVHPPDMLVVSGIVVLVSVIASLQPAVKASRMEPIKALRHV